ncbi:MAG TPA: SGNH/GDSL hydrolase family protein [Thermoanaerobaculia bacterium]|nr:SGNH/GDSL hydrolase family protein [Thermoanaerobaculia bacterium]
MLRVKTFASALALVFLLPAVLLPVAAVAQVDTGTANFTRYVAIGDSLTAAFMSGGLSRTAQLSSYPILINRQATGQTTGFEQPFVSDPGIPALLELKSLAPLNIGPRAGSGQPQNLNLPRPYNNLAVPGADVHDVVATVTDNGGLHDLILRGIGTQLQQAVALQPTFTTIWIGNNDVLGAALAGRVIEGVTITPVANFQADFRTIVDTIAGTGSRMAIANIPDVTGIPFVTTIPFVVVNPATNQPVIVNGQPVPLIGPNGLLTPGDRVLLTARAELTQGRGIPTALGGTGQPLSDAAVLSAAEISSINARVAAFNSFIQSEAARVGAAFVDMNATFRVVANEGLDVGGLTFTENFLTGGVFSYDGVHPNAFGYAYIANLFIEEINDQFGGEIPLVNLFPFIFGPDASTQTSTAAVETAEGGILTSAAVRNLFWALDIKTEAPKGRKPRKGRK